MKLKIIVNGQPAEIEMGPQTKLSTVIKMALEKTKNTGRPPTDWEIPKMTDGRTLKPSFSLSRNLLIEGDLIYVSLKVGYGG